MGIKCKQKRFMKYYLKRQLSVVETFLNLFS